MLARHEVNSIQLREAVPSDSDFVFDVRRQAFRKYVELAEGWDETRELELHLERFGRQRFRVIVAEDADVGYMATAIYPRATADYPAGLYLHQLMLLPSFQSRGFGAACVRLLAIEAHGLGMPIRLRVLRVNPSALKFYIGAGCRIVGESETHTSLELREEDME